MEHQDAYRQARRRVDAKLGFYSHLGVYIVVILLLIVVNLTTSPHYYWFIWPLLGWGIGVAAHGVGTFVMFGQSDLRERMIQRELSKGANAGQRPKR